jgi:hypothetical protein
MLCLLAATGFHNKLNAKSASRIGGSFERPLFPPSMLLISVVSAQMFYSGYDVMFSKYNLHVGVTWVMDEGKSSGGIKGIRIIWLLVKIVFCGYVSNR